jgi:diketogulonate reductase-like aldo/keto reductase
VRAIGVSNFLPHHIDELLKAGGEVPAVNQIELHPHLQQVELRNYCRAKGIHIESYSPLKRGIDVLTDPTIQLIANKHTETTAQIILRWHIQEGLVPIPKSVKLERIRQNIDVFDFELDDQDMQRIRNLDRNERVAQHPDSM